MIPSGFKDFSQVSIIIFFSQDSSKDLFGNPSRYSFRDFRRVFLLHSFWISFGDFFRDSTIDSYRIFFRVFPGILSGTASGIPPRFFSKITPGFFPWIAPGISLDFCRGCFPERNRIQALSALSY